MSALREVVTILIVTALIVVLVRLCIDGFKVAGPSMEPTYTESQRILVNKLAYWTQTPQRGDVVAVRAPAVGKIIIKRVIGLPGDEVVMQQGKISINGQLIEEPYVSAASLNPSPIRIQSATIDPPPQNGRWQVPADAYFIVGDNRPYSFDSRQIGAVPTSDIIGKVLLTWWPFINPRFWHSNDQI